MIDTGHELVFSLCRRFGFSLDRPRAEQRPKGADDVLCFDGGYYPWDRRWLDDWQAAGSTRRSSATCAALPPYPWAVRRPRWTPAGLAIDDMTLYDWIETRIPGGHSSRLGSSSTSPTSSSSARTPAPGRGEPARPARLSVGTGRVAGCYGMSDERWKIVGGQPADLARAGRLPRRLEHPLRLGADARSSGTRTAPRRRHFDIGGRRHRRDGRRVDPRATARRDEAHQGGGRRSTPAFGFDTRKLGSIDALGFGANNKLQLQIADRFWIGSGPWRHLETASRTPTRATRSLARDGGQPGTPGSSSTTRAATPRGSSTASKACSDTNDANPAVRSYVTRRGKDVPRTDRAGLPRDDGEAGPARPRSRYGT